MNALREHHSLAVLLKVSGLARSTFYYQVAAAKAGDRHGELNAKISRIFAQHKGCYGYRRITLALRRA
ncbi:IS3 family transposase, partial [Burkholderia lata]|uniref:IS3 family transposase n=1 Tax=Burkholderia lata (strain ATCC 17760 / DSM 23089 / LMG 22485 / NCIMB 9086 / R18194 / 383) TaxID=482957 RepID=UPI001582411E